MNFNEFSQNPETTATALKGWFIERTALTVAKIAEASGQVYYRQTAFRYIEENAYYALLDTITETVKETNEALFAKVGTNINGTLTGVAKYAFECSLNIGIIIFAEKALAASAK